MVKVKRKARIADPAFVARFRHIFEQTGSLARTGKALGITRQRASKIAQTLGISVSRITIYSDPDNSACLN